MNNDVVYSTKTDPRFYLALTFLLHLFIPIPLRVMFFFFFGLSSGRLWRIKMMLIPYNHFSLIYPCVSTKHTPLRYMRKVGTDSEVFKY
ncbi:hypothetical protein CPB83DRAFT_540172 [Crepidotus variabilis]|uniref:Uncharacterized protein n=1 Tax=Crepidotus variabilis TaxID=179855 RepID=A0A9P6EQV4_9AGAR|nr:hypothetical protein CPB83DRAFT_540172 [Crepidotus variabilis]